MPTDTDQLDDPAAVAFWSEVFPEGLPAHSRYAKLPPSPPTPTSAARLIPVDHDPFEMPDSEAESPPLPQGQVLIPVDHDPFASASAAGLLDSQAGSAKDFAHVDVNDLLAVVAHPGLGAEERDAIDSRLDELDGGKG